MEDAVNNRQPGSVDSETDEERRRRQARQREGAAELSRRRLTKSGQPASGLVDTPDTVYEDDDVFGGER